MKRKVFPIVFLIPLLCWLAVGPIRAAAAEEDAVAHCDTAIAAVQASSGFGSSMVETELGDMLADGVREGCGCDAAIVCGGHILHSISYGDITAEDVYDAVDSQARPVVVETVPAVLWELLEAALGNIRIGADEALDGGVSESFYYPQISGIELEYDASAPVGERIVSLVCNGVPLEPADTMTTISLALSEDYLLWEEAPDSLKELQVATVEKIEARLLLEYLGGTGSITVPTTDRVKVIGVRVSWYEKYKLSHFLPYLFLILLLIILPRQKHRLRNMDGSLSKRYKDYNV